jgi:hypothetical protein
MDGPRVLERATNEFAKRQPDDGSNVRNGERLLQPMTTGFQSITRAARTYKYWKSKRISEAWESIVRGPQRDDAQHEDTISEFFCTNVQKTEDRPSGAVGYFGSATA